MKIFKKHYDRMVLLGNDSNTFSIHKRHSIIRGKLVVIWQVRLGIIWITKYCDCDYNPLIIVFSGIDSKQLYPFPWQKSYKLYG